MTGPTDGVGRTQRDRFAAGAPAGCTRDRDRAGGIAADRCIVHGHTIAVITAIGAMISVDIDGPSRREHTAARVNHHTPKTYDGVHATGTCDGQYTTATGGYPRTIQHNNPLTEGTSIRTAPITGDRHIPSIGFDPGG